MSWGELLCDIYYLFMVTLHLRYQTLIMYGVRQQRRVENNQDLIFVPLTYFRTAVFEAVSFFSEGDKKFCRRSKKRKATIVPVEMYIAFTQGEVISVPVLIPWKIIAQNKPNDAK